jgi:archaellum component FlaC
MRTRLMALGLGLALATTPACDDPATREQLSRVRTEFGEAADELGDLGRELGDLASLQAGKLTSAMQGQLETLAERLDGLKADASQLTGKAKIAMSKAMDTVEVKRAELAIKLGELKHKGSDATQELREGVAAAFHDLAAALEAAKAAMDAPVAEAEAAEEPAADG